jgi:hypothetical protein
VPEE